MNIIRKISRIFSFLIIVTFLASCEKGCFSEEQFDSYDVVVDSKPVSDGIQEVSLLRDHANWHETGLKSSGDEFIIRITGKWTAWNGNSMTTSSLNSLPTCQLCARKNDNSSKNCICLDGQLPESYPGRNCEVFDVKGDYDSENDPTLCTCTTDPLEGYDPDPYLNLAYAPNINYRTLNYYEKDGTVKKADDQSRCQYNQGAGLYLGLFGPNGTTIPNRVYHLYTPNAICYFEIDDEGRCLDSDGNDRMIFEYRSANSRILMRNDHDGNTGSDTNTANDEYHTQNEVVKFKIYDEEYSNNFGQYQLQILRGVGDASHRSQVGILEFMVRLVENAILGEPNNNDERVGGIIEFMYRAIVQDSGFMGLLRICLILYVSIYGMAILSGVAEISKKELMSRIMKIGLVLLFTSNDSWQIYNDIVVAFFLDGMNSVISMITSMSLQSIDLDNSRLILDAQLDRGSNVSSSTRFTYIDNTIIMLMSKSVAAKTFGLILASPFGVLYVLVIYALIAIFIGVMAYAATVYLINVLKIVFALSLGPLFILFVLFGQTAQMFKNWISFLAGRSMELVILFLVLFNFVVVLNVTFYEMFSYKTCLESINLGLTPLYYLKSYIDRSLAQWMLFFLKILALCFITYQVMEKVGEIAGQLISVAGAGNLNSKGDTFGGSAAFGLAAKFMKSAASAAGETAGKAALASAYGGLALGKGAAVAARSSGIQKMVSKAASAVGKTTGLSKISKAVSQKSPISLKNPREFIRDQRYKGIISSAKKDVSRSPDTKNLTGQKRDEEVKKRALQLFENSRLSSKLADKQKLGDGEMHRHYMLGMSYETFQKTLDKELVEKPLMNFISKRSKELQDKNAPGGAKFGKDMRDTLHKDAKEWANKNLSGGEKAIKSLLEDKDNAKRSKFEYQLHNKIENSTKLSAVKAAKAFHGNEERQKAYMAHLQDRENEQRAKTARLDEERNKSRLAPVRKIRKVGGAMARGLKSIATEKYRPELARKNFARNLENQKARKEGTMLQSLANRANLTNRNNRTAAIAASVNRGAQKASSSAKGIASASYKSAKKYMGYDKNPSKAKKEQTPKSAKSIPVNSDRKTSMQNKDRIARDILREKLSSSHKNNQNQVLKSDIFSGKNIDLSTQHKSGVKGQKVEDKYKDRDDLLKEKKAFEDNRFSREALQKQLGEESEKSLHSKLKLGGVSLSSEADLVNLKSASAKEGGFDKLISGEKENTQTASAYEQASRLQYLNESFGLGDKDYKQDLMEKFNEHINNDIAQTQKAISDDVKSGDKESYEKHKADMESIASSKASAFSNFSNSEAGDNRYKEFFDNHMAQAMNNIQGRINHKYGDVFEGVSKIPQRSADKPGSDKDQSKKVPQLPKDSLDSTDMAAKAGDLSVERMTYYNDRDITDKLAKFEKEKQSYDQAFNKKEPEEKVPSKEKKSDIVDPKVDPKIEITPENPDKSSVTQFENERKDLTERKEQIAQEIYAKQEEIYNYDLETDIDKITPLSKEIEDLEKASKELDSQISEIDKETLQQEEKNSEIDKEAVAPEDIEIILEQDPEDNLEKDLAKSLEQDIDTKQEDLENTEQEQEQEQEQEDPLQDDDPSKDDPDDDLNQDKSNDDKVSSLRDRKKQLENRKNKFKKEIESIQEKIDSLDKDKDAKEIKDLESQLQTMTTQYEGLDSAILSVDGEISESSKDEEH